MRNNNPRGIFRALIGVLLVAPLAIGETNTPTANPTTTPTTLATNPTTNASVATEAQAQRFARIAKMSGPAYILRNGVAEWEDAAVNMVISEGDKIRTEDSYMEVQFDNGVSTKFDKNTEIEFTNLTKDETGEDITSIYVSSGKVRVTVPRYYNAEKRFYVQTPEGGIALEEQAKAQVEVIEGKSGIMVYEGRGKALSDEGDVSLLAGESTIIVKGQKPSHPKGYKTTDNNFDEWCENDEGEGKISRQYVPRTVVVGVDELDRHGRWVFVDSYGWVWRPSVHFGWRPYYHGHWTYISRRGWTWVSYEPWGWAPYHYGSWVYEWPYGWVWIPGDVWAPAWVCWYEEPGYIGWCPMGPYGRPWFHHSHHHMHMHYWVRIETHYFRDHKYRHHWHETDKPYRTSYKYREVDNKDVKWKNKVDVKPTGIKEARADKHFTTPTKNVLIQNNPAKKTPLVIDSKNDIRKDILPGKLNEKTIPAKPDFISRTETKKVENKVIESKPKTMGSKQETKVIENKKKPTEFSFTEESKEVKQAKTQEVAPVRQSKQAKTQEVAPVKESKQTKIEEVYPVKESKKESGNEVRNIESKDYGSTKNVERKSDAPRSSRNVEKPQRPTRGR